MISLLCPHPVLSLYLQQATLYENCLEQGPGIFIILGHVASIIIIFKTNIIVNVTGTMDKYYFIFIIIGLEPHAKHYNEGEF